MTVIFHGAIIGGFSATGVTFDGTNDYLRNGTELTGLVDGKVGTVSFWMKTAPGQDGTTAIILQNGTDAADFRMRLHYIVDKVTIACADSGGVNAITIAENTVTATDNAWHHYMVAWDAANAAPNLLYVDGAANTGTVTRSDRVIDYTRGEWGLGARHGDGALKLSADMAEFWFTTELLDISDAAVRAKFAKNGKPVGLGSNGSKPTGSAPMIYLRGGAANWGTNYAGTGDFTVVGAFADSATKPSY